MNDQKINTLFVEFDKLLKNVKEMMKLYPHTPDNSLILMLKEINDTSHKNADSGLWQRVACLVKWMTFTDIPNVVNTLKQHISDRKSKLCMEEQYQIEQKNIALNMQLEARNQSLQDLRAIAAQNGQNSIDSVFMSGSYQNAMKSNFFSHIDSNSSSNAPVQPRIETISNPFPSIAGDMSYKLHHNSSINPLNTCTTQTMTALKMVEREDNFVPNENERRQVNVNMILLLNTWSTAGIAMPANQPMGEEHLYDFVRNGAGSTGTGTNNSGESTRRDATTQVFSLGTNN
jgi:hypothetical protein